MGRPQITGNQVCPKCNNLGRVRLKNCRSRSSGRYVERSWFRHNDKNIPEHYIDSFTRTDYEKHPFGKTLKSIDLLCEAQTQIEHGIRLTEERLKAYDGSRWEHDEKWRFYMALDKVWKTVVEPSAKKIDVYRKVGKVIRFKPGLCLSFDDDQLTKRLGLSHVLSHKTLSREEIVQEAINQGHGPLLEQVFYLFEKYEISRRRKRDEDRRKKLSEWTGRKTNDYTGIADPSPSLLPS